MTLEEEYEKLQIDVSEAVKNYNTDEKINIINNMLNISFLISHTLSCIFRKIPQFIILSIVHFFALCKLYTLNIIYFLK